MHNSYKQIRKEGDMTLMDCGCVWIGHTCTVENMCDDAKRVAFALKRAVYGTDEGRARVAELRRNAGLA
jgi:hypothetical protein